MVHEFTFDEPKHNPRKVAIAFVARHRATLPGASICRILEAKGLITSPDFIIKTGDQFAHLAASSRQLRQTDRIYLKVPGLVWYYLSAVFDDLSLNTADEKQN